MRLLEEYTNLVDLGQEEKKIDFRYSEIGTDLVYIQRQLENAQVNLETLKVFGGREQAPNLHVI